MPLYSALSPARSLKGSADCDRMKARVAPHGVIHGAFMLCLLLRSIAGAVTFNVNSTADLPDPNIGNGVCATATAVCTLRAAIQEANAASGADIITLTATTYTL